MEWTEERIAQLKALWLEGLSASQIAEKLGGVSRNAVIGKAHRLGLAKRPSPIKRAAGGAARPRTTTPRAPRTEKPRAPAAAVSTASAPAAPRPARPAPKPERVIAQADSPEEAVGVMDLTERMCRWPIGHPGDPEFRFCGARTVTGLPYCAHHAQRAYQNVNLDKYPDEEPAALSGRR